MRRVVQAQELERTRLARELHDETGQALTSILLGLKTLEQSVESDQGREGVAAVRELVVSTLQNVRRLAVELRPTALDDFGLAPALERLAETVRQDTSVQVDLEVGIGERAPSGRRRDDDVPDRAGSAHEYRQARRGHEDQHPAGTEGARRRRGRRGRRRRLRPGDATAGLGLAGMRERVTLLGGQLRVETSPGRGTTIAAEVPLL